MRAIISDELQLVAESSMRRLESVAAASRSFSALSKGEDHVE